MILNRKIELNQLLSTKVPVVLNCPGCGSEVASFETIEKKGYIGCKNCCW